MRSWVARFRLSWKRKHATKTLQALCLSAAGAVTLNILLSIYSLVARTLPTPPELYQNRSSPVLAVVLAFVPAEAHKEVEMLENWRAFHPCETTEIRRGTALVLHCTSYEYDGRNALEKLAVRFTDSFEDVLFVQNPQSTFDAGSPGLLYSILDGSTLPSHFTHALFLESKSRPIRSGWLDHLLWSIYVSEPFWVRGTTLRGPCNLTTAEGSILPYRCRQVDKIADRMSSSTLYRVNDAAFQDFVADVKVHCEPTFRNRFASLSPRSWKGDYSASSLEELCL